MRVRISRRLLRWGGVVAGLVLLLGCCYVLGDRLTPRDAAGRPLILSPSVYGAERYRRAVLGWVTAMAEMDHGLTGVLAEEDVTDPGRLYDLGERVEGLVREAEAVARDAAFTPVPPALTGLAEEVRAAAGAYLEAARAAARWVGAPEPENRRAALEALRTARGLRVALEKSAWLDGR